MNTEKPSINVNDISEVASWSTTLEVTEEQLKGAVAQVGKLTKDVQPYLQRNEDVETETAKREDA